jgi:hypothetical protein
MRSENTGTGGGRSGCDELTATDLFQGKLLLRPEALAVDDAGAGSLFTVANDYGITQ